MKKTLVVILSLMLPLVWVWAAGEDAKEAVSFEQETEWQPEYGPKGDLLNPEPAVSLSRSSSGDIPDPPVIATTLLSEDFEDAAWGDPSTPPPGWTILDNGTEGTQMWYNDDWYKYYYSTWSDTTARIYYSGSAEDIYDEWLISPAIVLPGGATACSLTFKHYYNDRLQPGEDTAYVKITTDDGTTWNDVVIWDEDRTTSPYLENLDITAYDGNTVKIAFVLQANSGSYNDIYEWRIGYMDVWADAVNLLNEEFNNWGPGGGNPPSSWTIIDNGVPDTAQTDWNVNDYHDYTRWSSKTARIYYTSTYREWQDEWMISPSFSINALAAYCTLSVVEYYYHSTSTAPWGLEDHGYIKITTDAGTTWNVVYDNDVTKGSSSTKTTFKYDLMAYAGNTCQLAFHFVNSPSGSDYWNFDDVAIETLVPLDHDVATYAINAPTMGITGYDTDISVDVINLGLNTETFDDSTNMWLLNKNTLFYENFSDPQGWTGASPPVNIAGTWAVIDSGDEATPAWNNNDWHAYYYSTWTDTIARVYYYTSPYENMNEWLITPAFDMSSVTDVRLTFKQYYYDDSATETDTGWVLISSDDFAHVNVVAMYTSTQGSSSSPDYPDYDISAWAAGQSNVKIAFKYVGYSAWYWYLDNVELYEVLAPTLAYSGGETVTDLTSLEVRTVDYTSPFTGGSAGEYLMESFTKLGTDGNNSNDTLSQGFTVYEHYESGGPDAGNYSWDSDKDGGTGDPYSWIDITGIGTPVTWDYTSLENGYTYGIPLGFSFTFYDIAYDRIYLDKNGYASFDSITSSSNYTNYRFPSTLGPENIIGLLWDDLSDESGGLAYYYTNNVDTFIVSYENWDFDTDLDQRIDMQLILTGGDRGIKCQYKEVGPVIYTSHSIGMENAAGDVGLEFVYNGDPVGNIAMSGLAITFGYNPPAIDAAMTSVDEPVDGALVFNGSTVTPTVTVMNNSDAASSVNVTYMINDGTSDVYNQTEATSVIPGGGGSVQHAFATTWTATPDGDYDVTAYVTLAGDANPANDTLYTDFEVAMHYPTGGPDDYGYRWIDNSSPIEEDPPVFNWIDVSGTGDSLTSGDDKHSPVINLNFSFDFYGITYTTVRATTNGIIYFGDSTYITYTNDCPLPDESTPNRPLIGIFWDDMNVRTTDGGAVWGQYFDDVVDYYVIQYKNTSRIGQYGDPMNFEVVLYENGNILFQYLNVNDLNYGHGQSATIGLEDDSFPAGLTYQCNNSTNPGNLLQDSLAIKFYIPVYAHDVVAEEFISPPSAGLVNVAVTPEVLFTNNGTNDETSVPVYLYIDPGAYADTQTIAVLDSGTSVAQQFAQFTPTSGGTYTLTAVSDLAGDEDPASDTLVMQYTAYEVLLDFEADNGDLTGTGDWEWGTPTNPEGPANAYSGVNLWATNLAGDYTSGLSTLQFQLSVGSTAPELAFASWYMTEGDYTAYDGCNFAISTDGGTTWNVISSNRGYDKVAGSTNPLYPDSVWAGTGQQYWDFVTFDLSTYAGMIIEARFALGADASLYYSGWHIDDLALNDCVIVTPDIDVTPLAVSGEADPGFSDADTLTISNSGDGQLKFTANAYQDPFLEMADGTIQPIITGNRSRPDPVEFRAISQSDLAEFPQDKLASETITEPVYPPVINGAGGPDTYGHIWMDSDEPGGPAVSWIDISTIGTPVTWDNGSSHSRYTDGIAIGFPINFFGITYDRLFISENGVISFDSLTTYYSYNYDIPATSGPENMIAPWWDDLDMATGQVYYYSNTTDSVFVVSFNGVANYLNGGNLNFQAAIYADGSIDLNYGVMDPGSDVLTSSTIGIENAAGDDGLEIVYNADYMHDNLSLRIWVPTLWLSTTPGSGSIPPAGTPIDIEVGMDAANLNPGIYTGRIEIVSNDPDESLIDVPVSFIVGGLGTVAGQVTDANTASPIEGAIVTASWVSATTVVDTTDAGGNYSIVITPGTVNVTVEAVGYETDSRNVVVVRDQTTTHNVALGAPIATIDTSPVVDTVTVGDTSLYTRYLYNTGTAAMDYNVTLSTPSEGLLLSIGVNAADRESNLPRNAEIDPKYDYNSQPVISSFTDILFHFDAETGSSDPRCLGVEFDGSYFWVTGAGDGSGTQDMLHKFDRNGGYITSYPQQSTDVWGWRDLAWDGQYLYASDDYWIDQIDPATGSVVDSISGPFTPNRAIAYDPVNDLFYVANWGSTIYGITRAGVAVDTIVNTLSTYGMAYDGLTPGGPYLWTFNSGADLTVSQIDLATGTFTGVSFNGSLPEGYSGQIIGGMCFAEEWDPLFGTIFVLGQGDPDLVIGYEVTTTWFSAIENGSGTIPAGDSAAITFMADFRGPDIVVDNTYNADASINNNGPYSTPVIPFSITAKAAGCPHVVGDVNGSDNYNGLDITYGVAYFKGGADPLCPDCPIGDCNTWHYCGDVNGSCNYNGLDITYGVAYFKGGADPILCPDCPPIIGPASIGNEFRPTEQPAVESKSKSKKESSLKRQ